MQRQLATTISSYNSLIKEDKFATNHLELELGSLLKRSISAVNSLALLDTIQSQTMRLYSSRTLKVEWPVIRAYLALATAIKEHYPPLMPPPHLQHSLTQISFYKLSMGMKKSLAALTFKKNLMKKTNITKTL